MNKLYYYSFQFLFVLLAHLPWWMLRGLSYLFSLILRSVVHYRTGLVWENMRRSFPDATESELKERHKAYYEHFVSQYISTPKLLSLPVEELRQKHLYMEGMELFAELQARGHRHFIVLMAHYGNWELFSAAQTYFTDYGIQQEQIYRPLSNPYTDEIFIRLRSRYGSKLIAKNDTGRRLVAVTRDPQHPSTVFGFIADQTPGVNALHYWTNFLHQPTPFLDGAERLARKLELPILYIDIQRVGRFAYRGRFELLAEYPHQTPLYSTTELFVQRLEQAILRDSSLWLWSHKRWKHKFNPERAGFISASLSEQLHSTNQEYYE